MYVNYTNNCISCSRQQVYRLITLNTNLIRIGLLICSITFEKLTLLVECYMYNNADFKRAL